MVNLASPKYIQRALIAIPVSGLLGAIVLILRGPFNIPLTDSSGWISLVSSDNFLIYQNLLIFLYVLPFIGFLALHEYLKSSDKVEKYSFGGLILTLWGTALALPASGIISYIAVIAGDPQVTDHARIGQLITEAITGPGFYMGIVAAICYTLGPILFGIAIWRGIENSKIAAVLFALHGTLLSFGFSFFPALVAGWVLLAISGALIFYNLRARSLS